MIDSRDFIAARRRAETQVMLPPGPKVAFTGGLDFNDHRAIWDALDRVHAKHKGMVLLHGGSPKGAERIAACWAETRKVTQVAFKPDWTRHAKAAPFKRNDQLLETLPIGVVVFPGSGISNNLAERRGSSASRCSTSALAAAGDRRFVRAQARIGLARGRHADHIRPMAKTDNGATSKAPSRLGRSALTGKFVLTPVAGAKPSRSMEEVLKAVESVLALKQA